VAFCKYYFDKTAVFTVRADRIIACVSHMKDASGSVAKKENQGIDIPVTEEPIFSGVHRSGVAFFGRIDFSDAMGRLLDLPPSGECALLLVERSPEESHFLFALTAKESPNAIRYLKFFAEMMASAEEGDAGSQLLPVSERASRLVSEVDDIPPMSHVVNRVLQLLSEPERSIEDIASVLSEDQAMVARIIRVSNSALYRSLQEVRGLNSAMTRMGFKAIRSILLSSAAKDLLLSDKGTGGMWGRVLWQHAKECALASRRIAEQISYQDPEEAFVGGMLHDMGKMIILLKHQNLIPQIRKFQTAENLNSVEAERRVLGFSHSEIGGLLMQKWHMPEILTHCVRHHHRPDASGEGGQLAWIVSYGNCLSNLHGLNESIGTTFYEREIENFRRHFSLEDAQAEAFEHMVTEDFKKSEILD
jgi:HD-like signal output (HDOD) protein